MSFRVPAFTGAMLFGTCTTRGLRLPDGYHPILAGGSALGCLWLCDFLDSTVGPYRELTVTVLLAERPLRLPWKGPYTPVGAQLHPEAVVCEYTLVLDNPAAIAYGRDLHGFDKHRGRLEFTSKNRQFHFDVEMDGQRVVAGAFAERGLLPLPGALVGVVRTRGLVPTLSLLAAPQVRIPVITPPTVRVQRSELFFRGRMRLQKWSGQISYGEAPLGRLIAGLDFRPTAIQRVLSAQGWMPLSAVAGGRGSSRGPVAELVDERPHRGHDLGAAQDLGE